MEILEEEIIFEDINGPLVNDQEEFYERKDVDSVSYPPFIYSHSNKYRMRWDLLIIFLAIYNCVMTPIGIAMPKGIEGLRGLEMFENFVDFLFFLDIFLCFRTTYVNTKTNIEIVDSKKIAVNYVNSVRFPFDILASIPLEKVQVLFKEVP